VSPFGCSGIQISWPALRDATHYDVYRYHRNLQGQWIFDAEIASDVPGSPAFDTTGIPGVTYGYTVYGFGGCSAASYGDGALAVFPAELDAHTTSASGSPGQSVTLNATTTLHPQTASFQWFRNGQPLTQSAKHSGVNGPVLSIAALTDSDAGEYQVRVSTPCDEVTRSAVVAVTGACRADFNQSGGISVQDIFDFLAAYFAGCP
jgi:hypothetical protein